MTLFFAWNALRNEISDIEKENIREGSLAVPALLLQFFTCFFSYMLLNVVVKEVDRTTSRPFFSVRQIMELIGVTAAGDCLFNIPREPQKKKRRQFLVWSRFG